jgi:hypothetical protein
MANLDGLSQSEKASLSNLIALRDALFSDSFRTFLERKLGFLDRGIRLSPTKKDLSVNIYRCALLSPLFNLLIVIKFSQM